MRFLPLLTLFSAFISTNALAQTPRLSFPLNCTLGKNCWAVNHVDVDPSENSAKDFMCNTKTYENHQGTDFAIHDRKAMEKGIDVRAAMAGKVMRIRDGENDALKSDSEYQQIRDENRDCGNGILLDHGMGKQSFYCHLKENSIAVQVGDQVKRGQKIAQVGQSGDAQFPHLHFTFIWEGAHIDPFTGLNMGQDCANMKRPLWKDDIAYEPYAVFDGGFATTVPDFKSMMSGYDAPKTLSTNAPALLFWVGFYHARMGDNIELTITDPNGKIFAQRAGSLERNRQLPSYFYAGRTFEDGEKLTAGEYKGQLAYKRENFPTKNYNFTITVTE